LRADHLGAYGYARDTSPEFDAFAARSLRFSQAFSTARKTAPSHASMFTSLYPTVHGVFMNDVTPDGQGSHYRLAPEVPTLAELLADAGFETVAWHGGGNMSASYGFSRGFSQYHSFHSYRGRGKLAAASYREREWRPAFRWLEEQGGERFFMFLHTYAIHDPYQPPEPFYSMFTGDYRGRIRAVPNNKRRAERYWAAVDEDDPRDMAHLVDLYDGGIRYADAHLRAHCCGSSNASDCSTRRSSSSCRTTAKSSWSTGSSGTTSSTTRSCECPSSSTCHPGRPTV
jgi:arylsulfatase A-like enzyme